MVQNGAHLLIERSMSDVIHRTSHLPPKTSRAKSRCEDTCCSARPELSTVFYLASFRHCKQYYIQEQTEVPYFERKGVKENVTINDKMTICSSLFPRVLNPRSLLLHAILDAL